MMDDRTEMEQLYRTYWQYMIDKNAEGLRKLFTEDYCLEHMTGVKQSAETFLKGLLDGTFNYYSAVHEGIDAAVHGDTATLTGKSRGLSPQGIRTGAHAPRQPCAGAVLLGA